MLQKILSYIVPLLPHYWHMDSSVDAVWDRQLNALLDTDPTLGAMNDDLHVVYIDLLIPVWASNYPYSFGMLYKRNPEKRLPLYSATTLLPRKKPQRPRRRTIYRLKKYIEHEAKAGRIVQVSYEQATARQPVH